MLAGAISAPVFGRLGDLFGRRRILIIVLGLMLAGSVLGAVSSSYAPLIIARSLQGAAFGVIPLGISLLKDALPADRAGSGVATMSATLGAGGAIGLPLAGFLATFADWHVLFWLSGAVSLAAMASAGCSSPNRRSALLDGSTGWARSACPPLSSACCWAFRRDRHGAGPVAGRGQPSRFPSSCSPHGLSTSSGRPPRW